MTDKNDAPDASTMESFSGSWIKLDSRNETAASETSPPKLSDEETMTKALEDAQTEMSKSVTQSQPLVSEEADANENDQIDEEVSQKTQESRKSRMSLRGSKIITGTYDLVEHPCFYVSALLLSHTFALAVGIFIGRKMVTQSR